MRILLTILYILFYSTVTFAEQNTGFVLDTRHFIKHEALKSKDIIASESVKKIDILPNAVHTEDGLGFKETKAMNIYCPKQKRSLQLSRNQEEYAYLKWKAGLHLQYRDCRTGNMGTLKIKSRTIKAEYTIAF